MWLPVAAVSALVKKTTESVKNKMAVHGQMTNWKDIDFFSSKEWPVSFQKKKMFCLFEFEIVEKDKKEIWKIKLAWSLARPTVIRGWGAEEYLTSLHS